MSPTVKFVFAGKYSFSEWLKRVPRWKLDFNEETGEYVHPPEVVWRQRSVLPGLFTFAAVLSLIGALCLSVVWVFLIFYR